MNFKTVAKIIFFIQPTLRCIGGLLNAVASGDYTFSRWSDGDTSASRTVTVNEDLSLTAYFTKTTSGGESSETNPDGGGGNLGD